MDQTGWRMEMGAQVTPNGVRFRVWAPRARHVEVELKRADGSHYFPLDAGEGGVLSATVPEAKAGDRYRYRLDGGSAYPDPCSRAQPEGVHAWSEVVDPAYDWNDDGWTGIRQDELIIYELHVGAFTPEGTFEAIIPQLDELKALGITALELLPIAEFPGRRNWGYDGVYLFAPSLTYGGVIGLKRLVDAAHQRGLAVLLDVVYNHLGPSGNYLGAYSGEYFTDRYHTPWGEAMNFDGPGCQHVRQFVIENAAYWLNEYHIDGLRLDSTHAIFDSSPVSILQELADTARASVGPGRSVVIIAENENNDSRLVRPKAEGGYGLDGVWADDFHHAVRTFLTHESDGYYADYPGTLDAIAFTLKNGWLYQGEFSSHWGRMRGTPSGDVPAERFVICIQNHDQVGNRAFGERLNHQVPLPVYAVASALLALAPETPLLFMGQEFAASTPFLFFTDHEPDLGRLVTEGRREEFKKFRAFSDPHTRERIPDPQREETFLASKLKLSERQTNAGIYQWYKDLLDLRRNDFVFRRPDRQRLDVKVVGSKTLVVHRWTDDGRQRFAVFNFGEKVSVAMPSGLMQGVGTTVGNSGPHWRVQLTSTNPQYGLTTDSFAFENLHGQPVLTVPATSAVVLAV